jgi:hypothetical protein
MLALFVMGLMLILAILITPAYCQSAKAQENASAKSKVAQEAATAAEAEPVETEDILDVPLTTDYRVAIVYALAHKHEPGDILIKFKPRGDIPDKDRHRYDQTVRQVLQMGAVQCTEVNGCQAPTEHLSAIDTYLVRTEEVKRNPVSIFNRLKNNPFVVFVEPNYHGFFD